MSISLSTPLVVSEAIGATGIQWTIETFMNNLPEYLKVGLNSAVTTQIVSPLLINIYQGRDMFAGIKIADNLTNMIITGGLSAGIYALIQYLFPDMLDNKIVNRYVAIVAAIITSDMLLPIVNKKWMKKTPPATTVNNNTPAPPGSDTRDRNSV
jgi:hypothetical protein